MSPKYKHKKIEGFELSLTPSGSTKIKFCGILPPNLCEPTFLDDPSHRKKVIGKHFYQLENAKKSVSLVDKNLEGKISSYWGYILHRISTLYPKKYWRLIGGKEKRFWNIYSTVMYFVEFGVITIKVN